jgi:hypothetical protein
MRPWRHRSTNGATTAVANRKAANERRDMSTAGVARRKRFDESPDLLCALGLSPAAVDRNRHLARKSRKLPHEQVCTMAEHAAEDVILAALAVSGKRPRIG